MPNFHEFIEGEVGNNPGSRGEVTMDLREKIALIIRRLDRSRESWEDGDADEAADAILSIPEIRDALEAKAREDSHSSIYDSGED
jgi:hypothetical protein